MLAICGCGGTNMATVVDVSSLLKIANSPVLSQFLHDCVDDLTDAKAANFDNYNSDIEWTIEDFNKAKSAVQNFYRECVLKNDCNFNADCSVNVQQEIRNCFEIRKDDIYEALVKERLINNGCNLVESFDWKLKWVLGSLALASLRQPLLQVDLNCLQRGPGGEGTERNRVNFEVGLEKLDLLIGQLEKVKAEVKSK